MDDNQPERKMFCSMCRGWILAFALLIPFSVQAAANPPPAAKPLVKPAAGASPAAQPLSKSPASAGAPVPEVKPLAKEALPPPPRARNIDEVVKRYRELFLVLEKGHSIDEVMDRSRWPDHDLFRSYLELELLYHPRYRATLERVLSFLKRWPDHPHAERINRLADRKITQSGSDSQALAWYEKRKPTFRSGQLRYLQLLVSKARYQDALVLYADLYRQGVDFPRELRRRVERLPRFSTALKDADHEARALVLAEKRNDTTLYRMLPMLSEKRQLYYRTLAAARQARKNFTSLVQKLPKELATSPELWNMRIEGLRRNEFYDDAYDLLAGREGSYLVPADRQLLRFRLGRHYFYAAKNVERAFHLFNANAKEKGGELEDSLWFAGFSAYLTDRKELAYKWFELLGRDAPSAEERSQGAFWAAKAAFELGMGKDRVQGLLERAATLPHTFYGLLAAEMLPGGSASRVRVTEQCQKPQEILKKDRGVGMTRMRLLERVKRSYYNGYEVDYLADKYGLSDWQRVCLALAFNAPEKAVKLSREVLKKEGKVWWQGLYPYPDWTPATGWQLPKSLVWGLVRQESLFAPGVESSASAKGLMQLIPPTARKEAQILRMMRPNSYLLSVPEYNMSLGQSYLKRMLANFDQDYLLGFISYNAGPGRAQRWKNNRATMDHVTFVETVPITETRGYIKLVSHNVAIYRILYPDSSVSSLRAILAQGVGSGKKGR